MSYQGYQGYSNVPSTDQQQQGNNPGDHDPSMTNPNVIHVTAGADNPHNAQSAYRQYTQNSSFSSNPTHIPPSMTANFGDYGPNVGSVDWVVVHHRSKKNRLIAFCTAALVFLLLLHHSSGTKRSKKHSGGGSGAGYPPNPANSNPDISSSHAISNHGQKGVPGDGTFHEEEGLHHEDHSSSHNKGTDTSSHETTQANTSNIDATSTTVSNPSSNSNLSTNDGDGNGSDDGLKIIQLLTYPMSGTTYTLRLYGESTRVTVATNYAYSGKRTTKDGHNLPVFPNSNTNTNIHNNEENGSPYWTDAVGTGIATTKPSKYVLSVSHCHGYCFYPCKPDRYVQTLPSFEEGCRSVYGPTKKVQDMMEDFYQPPKSTSTGMFGKNADHNAEKNDGSQGSGAEDGANGEAAVDKYIIPRSKVAKVVHLIRDPISNVVSRFHEYRRLKLGFPDRSEETDREEFRDWCKKMDSDVELMASIADSFLITSKIKEVMKDVPCHSEFFKYVAWHNHVVDMIWNKNYKSLTIYYEDYAKEERTQAEELATFAEESLVSADSIPSIMLLITVRMYKSYLTDAEIQSVEIFVRTMAYPNTMQLLERYFTSPHGN
jgi:hypothetical protein